jgi:hypothetical protein
MGSRSKAPGLYLGVERVAANGFAVRTRAGLLLLHLPLPSVRTLGERRLLAIDPGASVEETLDHLLGSP